MRRLTQVLRGDERYFDFLSRLQHNRLDFFLFLLSSQFSHRGVGDSIVICVEFLADEHLLHHLFARVGVTLLTLFLLLCLDLFHPIGCF